MIKKKTFSPAAILPEQNPEHKEGLLFCRNLRIGQLANIEGERIWTYARCFYENYLVPHLDEEERDLFVIADVDDVHVRKARADHRRLRRLFENVPDLISLNHIEEKLEQHIRFEEKILIPHLLKIAGEGWVNHILNLHARQHRIFRHVKNWPDRYWEQ